MAAWLSGRYGAIYSVGQWYIKPPRIKVIPGPRAGQRGVGDPAENQVMTELSRPPGAVLLGCDAISKARADADLPGHWLARHR